jgi:hypothetical protein
VNDEAVRCLQAVLERFNGFNRLGALKKEGGERAFRGWLMSGFLLPALGWPWDRIVLGESMDILALDWMNKPVVYIETKTPTQRLRVGHRGEMSERLDRWGSLRYAVLTNGWVWERFDDLQAPLGAPSLTYSLEDKTKGSEIFSALFAHNFVRA